MMDVLDRIFGGHGPDMGGVDDYDDDDGDDEFW
jgi:hypothetical protein